MDPALKRLRDPQSGALADLARLMVDDVTSTPLRDLVHPRWIASQLATGLEAVSRGDLLHAFVERRMELGLADLKAREDLLREHFPSEVDGPLREVLRHPWTPDPGLTLRVLDQAAMRNLVASVLTRMLVRFRGRMSQLDGGVLKSIGGRAARRSRGLFGGIAEFAEQITEVVKEEVEHGLDERVRDFVDGATRDAMKAIADYLSDPEHAEAFAELRVGVLDVLLDTSVGDLVGEVDKARPLDILDVVVLAVRQSVGDETFVDRAEERIGQLLDEAGDGTLRDWLQEVELLDVWTATTGEFLVQRLEALVGTEAFETWWTNLHRGA